MQVPLLDLKLQYQSIKTEIDEAIQHVLDSQDFIMGKEVSDLEDQICTYTGSKYAIACASGSDALLLSLMALDIKEGDYVITTPYTFFATAGAISRLGAIPIFIDIKPEDFNIDVDLVEQFLEGKHPLNYKFPEALDNLKAIIPVHLYGQMADMDRLEKLAKRYDLFLVEDAAQAIGSSYQNKQAGTIGDFGCFSFFPSKNLGAYGDAGLITTQNEQLAEKARILRLHGSKPKYHHKMIGINSRLDSLQAAVLKVKLQYLDQWSAKRKEIADYYNQEFQKIGLVGKLEYNHSFTNKILTPAETTASDNGNHIYHQYVLRVKDRDGLQKHLNDFKIGNAIYYPVPLHEQECFSFLGYKDSDCPISSTYAKDCLALPIFPELERSQQDIVIECVANFYK